MIGIDVLALQRVAFRSCRPQTYLFADKPDYSLTSQEAKGSSHRAKWEEGGTGKGKSKGKGKMEWTAPQLRCSVQGSSGRKCVGREGRKVEMRL